MKNVPGFLVSCAVMILVWVGACCLHDWVLTWEQDEPVPAWTTEPGVINIEESGDGLVISGFFASTPCDPNIPCFVEYDENNDWLVRSCTKHTPGPIVLGQPTFELVVENDPNYWVDLAVDTPTTLTIGTETGGELILSFEGDRLQITGDADMNEAAEMFFREFVKSIADDYIKTRLQETEK